MAYGTTESGVTENRGWQQQGRDNAYYNQAYGWDYNDDAWVNSLARGLFGSTPYVGALFGSVIGMGAGNNQPWRYEGTRNQYLRDPNTNMLRAQNLADIYSGQGLTLGGQSHENYRNPNQGGLANLVNSYTREVAPWENIVWYQPPETREQFDTLVGRAQGAQQNVLGDLYRMTGAGNRQQNYDPSSQSYSTNQDYNAALPSAEDFQRYGADPGYSDWLVNNYAGSAGTTPQAPATPYVPPQANPNDPVLQYLGEGSWGYV